MLSKFLPGQNKVLVYILSDTMYTSHLHTPSPLHAHLYIY